VNLFILTGAGISAESGLGTFRDREGLWRRFDPMRLATPEAFAADPDEVHAFYNLRRQGVVAARPNAAHEALARLESELAARGDDLFLCTQNVDDLHERAGSGSVTHMHGKILKSRCTACLDTRENRDDLVTEEPCPACRRTGTLRPDIVWFGEMPMHLDRIGAALDRADLFVAIGTSGAVYPAAGFVAQARRNGIRTLELNLEPSDNAGSFDDADYGPAGTIVPAFVNDICRRGAQK
jgi:NAD-dependent deacetylase